MSKILIVEDDSDIGNMLKELLTAQQYQVNNAYSGTEALFWLEKETFDLVLLDLMLPGMSGEEVLQSIRKHSDLAVIAISAKDDKNTKLSLLKDGADDYITKPFDTDELLVRIEVVLRRKGTKTKTAESAILQFKDIVLNDTEFTCTVNETAIPLTKFEYNLLHLLMSNPKKVFTKNNIYESVWEEDFMGEENAVNVHICNIRSKLAKGNPDQKYIQTVWGIGFKMQVEE
ncbi:response regulator transcription factor [Anaerosporobacter faecicola]|uniref:response regulator transcription factor n=1 Tax=Anaerosporobacter faecicola TaxID=2718714 RepID=UPI00143AACE1|nr:response regulator transcription factor [Anaerosporobacter faecicola]